MSIGRRILFYNGLPTLCQCAQQVFSRIGAGCQFQLLFQSKIGIGDDSQRKDVYKRQTGLPDYAL